MPTPRQSDPWRCPYCLKVTNVKGRPGHLVIRAECRKAHEDLQDPRALVEFTRLSPEEQAEAWRENTADHPGQLKLPFPDSKPPANDDSRDPRPPQDPGRAIGERVKFDDAEDPTVVKRPWYDIEL